MKKIVTALIIINGMQLAAGMTVCLWAGASKPAALNNYLYVTVFLMLLCNVATIIGLYLAMKDKDNDLEESLHNIESLNATLRAQRHDYLNHFQVIFGLMELEEYQEARKYLYPVFKDIMKVSKALKTSQPAVNALLQIKMEAAEQAGVDFYPEIRSELKSLPMEAWNLCKILANIIDNGIYILTTECKDREEKKIILEISENETDYFFVISNNGPEIPKQIREEIFHMGFSSKREAGHGMGLYIVSKIVKENDGEIRVESSPDKTDFYIRIPKKDKN